MLYWALIFLVIALVAGVLGLPGVAAIAADISWILFVVGLILAIVFFVVGRRRGPRLQANFGFAVDQERNMTARLLSLIFAVFVSLVAVAGCNTIEGAGEDIESLGEEVQEEAG